MGRKWVLALALAGALPSGAVAQRVVEPTAVAAIERGLHKQTGDIDLPAANAVLHLGQRYYFLNADEARRVLVDVWGNPPGSADGVLGLVLPAGKTVVDNVWGAVVTYDPSGYVSDEDAHTADYAKMLADIRAGEPERNAERAKQGYPAINLVGWAQSPTYDARSHSVVWAREFRLGQEQVHGLNYDVRLLGRRGVLSLNMLSDMPHLSEVRAAATDFGRTASFVPGATYADFNEALDEKADYGVAGLVAAGIGVAAAKKLGLLAILLAFAKKGFVLLAIAGAAAWRWVNRLVGRGDDGGEEAA